MKSSFRMFFALLLIGVLLLSAGCASNGGAPAPTETPAEAPAATEAPAEEGGEPAVETVSAAATKEPLNADTTVSTMEVDDNGWAYVSCGNDYVMALTADGTLCGWGRNTYGQVGSATYKEPNVMSIQPVLKDIVALDTGEQHTCAISGEGVMYIWGSNHSGRLGDGTTAGRTAPTVNSTLVATGEKIIDIAPGMNCTLAIAEDGTLYGIGSNSKGQLGIAEKEIHTPMKLIEGVAQAFSNGEYSFAIKTDGTVWATGNNKKGQLGTGDTESLTAWTQIDTISDVKTFALGEEFALALKTDGTLWATGSNKRGQLGVGSDEASVSAWTQVAEGVSSAFAGVETAGMIKEDGTLWMWGMNKFGQIGDGTTANKNAPVQVMTDVKQADCGDGHAAALKNDGSVWVWGSNKYYQLCDGTTTDCATPKQVVTK